MIETGYGENGKFKFSEAEWDAFGNTDYRISKIATTGSLWIDFSVLKRGEEIVNLHPMSLVGLPSKHETPLFSEATHFSAQGAHFQQQIFDYFYSSDHYAIKANHMSMVHLIWYIIWSTNYSMLDKTQHQMHTDKYCGTEKSSYSYPMMNNRDIR